jgi:hypothetical protein
MEGALQENAGTSQALDPVSSGIISAVLYFDIFSYPLTLGEIKYNCHHTLATEETIERCTIQLVKAGRLFERGGFYLLSPDDAIIARRVRGNALAGKFQARAGRYARLIASFPFVRCVCISGSLSKGFMEADSDVDYFIITRPGRLWLSRTLLVFFKKVFLLNSKKYFCVNYFVDENSLGIPDRNIFTATELSFIVPQYNYPLYHQLIMANSWCRDFYPNKKIARDPENMGYRNGPVKRMMERILGGRLGERLDNYFFRYTLKHWKKKFPGFDEAAFDLQLRSRKNVSKHHPQGFQSRVLQAFSERRRNYESRFSVSLAG